MNHSYIALLKKKRTIALLLLCGAVGAMVLYDKGAFLPSRKELHNTYIVNKYGLFNGLGQYIPNPLYKPIASEFHSWDITGSSVLATQFSWKKSTYMYVNTHDNLSKNNWIMDSYKLVTLRIDNNHFHEITALGTTTKTGSVGGCRLSPLVNMAACFQGKDAVVFDVKTGAEIQRHTYPGGDPGSNFEKMEWLSEGELALLDDSFGGVFEKNIQRLNVLTGEIIPVCDTDARSHMESGVLKRGHKGEDIHCSDLPEYAVLFGSREWPVQEKYPSDGPVGDRFYFYPRWIPGPWLYPGKTWIEGYDRETGDTFYVATVDSILKSIFGDSFIVDWFGWSLI